MEWIETIKGIVKGTVLQIKNQVAEKIQVAEKLNQTNITIENVTVNYQELVELEIADVLDEMFSDKNIPKIAPKPETEDQSNIDWLTFHNITDMTATTMSTMADIDIEKKKNE